MNYCIVAFAVWLAISVFQWFFDGRKNYTGPKMDIDAQVLVATDSVPVEQTGVDAPLGSAKNAGGGMHDTEKY